MKLIRKQNTIIVDVDDYAHNHISRTQIKDQSDKTTFLFE